MYLEQINATEDVKEAGREVRGACAGDATILC